MLVDGRAAAQVYFTHGERFTGSQPGISLKLQSRVIPRPAGGGRKNKAGC